MLTCLKYLGFSDRHPSYYNSKYIIMLVVTIAFNIESIIEVS